MMHFVDFYGVQLKQAHKTKLPAWLDRLKDEMTL